MEKYWLFFCHLIITRWIEVLFSFIRLSIDYYDSDCLSNSQHRLLSLSAMCLQHNADRELGWSLSVKQDKKSSYDYEYSARRKNKDVILKSHEYFCIGNKI